MSEHGLPCWYELATADPAAVQPFYAALLGWQFADSGMAGMTYIIASAQDSMVAGLFKAEPEQPTGWAARLTSKNRGMATGMIWAWQTRRRRWHFTACSLAGRYRARSRWGRR